MTRRSLARISAGRLTPRDLFSGAARASLFDADRKSDGTGLVTSYKQLVSDQLGVDPDRVDVIMGDTNRTPSGLSGGSRALAVGGAALYEAGRTIIDKGAQLAAHLLEVSAQDVRFADGVFSVPGTDLCLDVFAVAKAARDPAKLPAGMELGLDTKHHRVAPAQTFPNGCHIV